MCGEENKIKISVFDSLKNIETLEDVNDIPIELSEDNHSFYDLKEDDINASPHGIMEMKKNQCHTLLFLNHSCHFAKGLDQLCSRTSVAQVTQRQEKLGISSEMNISMVDIKEDRDDKEKQVLRDIALMSLLESYGASEKIFIPWLELKKMNIFFFNDLKYQFFQQKFPAKFFESIIYTSYFSFYFLLGVSIILLGLSVFLFHFSNNFVQVYVPYDSTSVTSSLDLSNVLGWRGKAAVSIYADLQDFQSVYKSLTTSRASEELKNLCEDLQTFGCFKKIRDITTVPEISSIVALADDAKMFPYGILEYLYFNDYFDIIHSYSEKSVRLDTTNITTLPKLVLFLKKALRCQEKSSLHCWISPILPRFQNWMNIEYAYKNRLLLANVPDGLLPEKYTIVWSQNVWPSESLNVKKSLVFVQFSVLGASQIIPCIVCLCVGCITFILTLFFNYFKNA